MGDVLIRSHLSLERKLSRKRSSPVATDLACPATCTHVYTHSHVNIHLSGRREGARDCAYITHIFIYSYMLATTLCAYIVWLLLYEYTTTMSLEYACTLRAPGTISYTLYKRWRISAQLPQPYPPCILRAVPTAEVYLL